VTLYNDWKAGEKIFVKNTSNKEIFDYWWQAKYYKEPTCDSKLGDVPDGCSGLMRDGFPTKPFSK